MASAHEPFWQYDTYAVVGNASHKAFPKLTYNGLKDAGKQVYAIDSSVPEVEGDKTYPDFASLPSSVHVAVLELPRGETAEWVERAADAGITHVWIHQGTETPEALALAEEHGLDVHSGGCAVMYLVRGYNAHTFHKSIWKLLGKY